MVAFRSLPTAVEPHPTGWAEVPGTGVEVTKLPLVSTTHALPDGTPLFGRLTYADALAVAAQHRARLLAPGRIHDLRRPGVAVQLTPYLGTPTAETDLLHAERHDADVWRQLRALGWDGTLPVVGAGKHWVAGAPPGRSRLEGWDRDGAGPGLALWQPDAVAHNREHFDDGTTTVLERDTPARAEAFAPLAELVGELAHELEDAAHAVGSWFAPDRTEAAPPLVVPPHPIAPALPGRELPAVRTPVTARELYAALGRALPGFSSAALELLVAQSAHETDGWRACWNFSLGNEKANPGWRGAYCYRYCDEALSQAQAAQAIAQARPRSDGSGQLDARIKGTRKDGKAVVEFWASNPYARFRAFASLDEAVKAWLAVLRLPRYAAAWAALTYGDDADFVAGLAHGGYFTATASSYLAGLRWRLGIVRGQLA